MDPLPEETRELRLCLRELAALSTLSAVWSRNDAPGIAEGLCRVLCRSMSAALVYVRLGEDPDSPEAAMDGENLLPPEAVRGIGRTLEPLLHARTPDFASTIPDPSGRGALRLAISPVGLAGDCGVVVVGSKSPDFPRQTDRLLLGVGANQAAIVLQQRRAEEQTRRSERELSDFFDSASVGLHWVGADGIILRANRAELNMVGYEAHEYVGRHIAEFHADAPVIEDLMRRLWNGEKVHGFEARIRCKDGSIKDVLIDSSVLWENGRFVHTRCFTLDITQRKLAEASSRKLAAIVESSDDAIVGTDQDGTIVSWNRGAERIYGYAAAEILGRPISLLVPPSHPDEFASLLQRLRREERIEHFETTRVRKDGALVDVSLTISPVKDDAGRVVGVSKIARDVTDRIRTGEALRKQTERLRLLWESAAVVLTAENPDAMLRGLLAKIGTNLGVDTYFNFVLNEKGDALRLASCAGIDPETAGTITRIEFGQSICGTVAQHRRPIVASHVQESEDPKAQLIRSFGIRAYACNPLLVGDRLLGTLSFASRTRDRFDADEVAFLETLCHYVTVAYERLRLLAELKEADVRKNEFLATLAHELRNPLAPVRNALQVLGLKGPDEPEARWGREVIDRQVEHLAHLIDDLMDVSRITRDRLELRRQDVEFAEIVRGAVESSRPALEEFGHHLEVTLPEETVVVHGDPVRLTQVFMNLLNNAAKYTGPGGRIGLAAERRGEEIVVRVTDTGVGIPPAQLARLFEMFYQVDRTRGWSQGGLGIGLSLVRRLVELHGGRVEAHSEGEGRGSEFVVRLPIVVDAARLPPRPAPGGNGRPAPASRRILVVDDNRDAAESLAVLLRMTGNDVATAYDGVEGVEAAERFRPGVVLLDIGMPRMNGEDACRRLRAEPWSRDMILVALTGWGQEEDRRRTAAVGFDAHVVKPVSPSILMDLVDQAERARGCGPRFRGGTNGCPEEPAAPF